MTVYPLLRYEADRPDGYREEILAIIERSMKDAVREAYDKGLNDGRKWEGNGAGNPYRGREIEEELGAPLFSFVRRFASARPLEGGSPI
jgi:hypothetical protein